MYRHGLGTQGIERSSMSHMNDVIDMTMSTFEIVPMAVMIGGGMTKRIMYSLKFVLRDTCFKWEFIELKFEFHILNLVLFFANTYVEHGKPLR